MKNAGPLATALAALIVAVAAWLGLDLDALRAGEPRPGTAGLPSPSTPGAPAPPPGPPATPPGGVPVDGFDYYVLALSWSPSFCESEATERDALQCETTPHAFIVHGLWPQNDRGYPEDCPTDTPRVPDALIDEMLDIMPSRGLIGHQWRAHGACTGKTQEQYFAAVRAAWEAIVIPRRFDMPDAKVTPTVREVVGEFLRANPEFRPEGIVVTCDGDLLDEVRLCMTKDYVFQSCGPQTLRSACRRERVEMPPPHSGAPR